MKLTRCKKCGDTTPPGKELCWCCEHSSKLHPEGPKPEAKQDGLCDQEVGENE